MNLFLEFVYLQVLDALTTIAFMMYGVAELNPLIKWAMRESPSALTGLLLVKILAVGLAFYCIVRARQKLLRKVNIFFALVVDYNVVVLILSAPVLQ